MPIRFHCGNCGKPIEVDDPWAGRPVICPYCNERVEAPAESTIHEPSPADYPTVPVDTSGAGRYEPGHGPQLYREPERRSSNGPAVAALILACILAAFSLLSAALLIANKGQFRDMAARTQQLQEKEGMDPFTASNEAWMRLIEEQGGQPPFWLVALNLLSMSSLGLWVAVLITAILGLRRAHRRHFATAALVISMLVPVFCCGSMFAAVGF